MQKLKSFHTIQFTPKNATSIILIIVLLFLIGKTYFLFLIIGQLINILYINHNSIIYEFNFCYNNPLSSENYYCMRIP